MTNLNRNVTSCFISLGPACFTAGVLQKGGLRRCSFPLDWARTGGHLLADLFSLREELFYYKYIDRPSIHLELAMNPTSENKYTSELKQITHHYGFPYFFNPHKQIGTDKDYFLRCLMRLKQAINNPTNMLHFLAIDQPENAGEKYFNDVFKCTNYIESIIKESLPHPGNFSFTLARVFRTDELSSAEHLKFSEVSRISKVYVPRILDENGIAPLVAKLLFDKSYRSLPLYDPGDEPTH